MRAMTMTCVPTNHASITNVCGLQSTAHSQDSSLINARTFLVSPTKGVSAFPSSIKIRPCAMITTFAQTKNATLRLVAFTLIRLAMTINYAQWILAILSVAVFLFLWNVTKRSPMALAD